MTCSLFVVNPRSRGARGRYHAIRARVATGTGSREVSFDDDWEREVDAGRYERIVAVGGDGTVGAVANALLARAPLAGSLGAIGVGSSNDFHKPWAGRIAGVPVRLGPPVYRDVGLARWTDARGVHRTRWFVVGASLGIAARANRSFGALERGPVGLRIARAAMSAALSHENVAASVDGGAPVALTNLAALLGTHLAGSLRFPAPHGGLGVHLSRGLSRAALVRSLARLHFGRFDGESRIARAVDVALAAEDDLELDGEVVRACHVQLSFHPRALRVCS